MMTKINPIILTENGPGRFVTEASSLGWKPGKWPEKVDGSDIGNGLILYRRRRLADGGMVYVQAFGSIEIHVLND